MSPALRIKLFFALAALCLASAVRAQDGAYAVSGRVIDRLTRQPVAYAAVVPVGQEQRGASTDSLGRFRLERVRAGIFRLSASSVGYKTVVTPEYLVSAATPFIEIEMEEDATQLEAVTVVPSPFRATAESPVGLQVIGVREIEKSPGANRDVSRIVRSYPGVSFSPVGYRNDLIVRGGGPSENKFYLDGIEIPNINHFATQGATGGPVSILNADLIREINFYTGAFPADRSGALSSVLDIQLRDGNPEKQTFKATLGASEVSLSGSGHIGEKTSYLFSLRQSYLQLLFKMIGLPFLPNYIDGQLKVKTRLSEHDELTVLGLAGFDNMKLNLDEEGEDAEYLLSYLPRIRQETFTVGAAWRHYAGRHVQTVSLGHTYLNNRNLKYRGNDDSSEDNLTLRLRSVEQKTTLRAENRSYLGRWTVREGAELSYSGYTNRTEQRLFTDEAALSDYRTRLGIVGWGLFAGADYASADKRFTASVGVRADGADYSARMARFWRQLSPRASVSYQLGKGWLLSGSAGLYYQLPPYTALGFKQDGVLVNEALDYLRVGMFSVGGGWRLRDRLVVSVEGFYKKYGNIPLSVSDGIPLSCKGDDYGVVGNEALRPTAVGRSYGIEAMARWQIPGRVNLVGSVTLFRDRLVVSVEGFYKKYGNIPLSVSDGIPLSCKGDDYGVVGNEALRPTAVGRSYGIEAMARWQIPGRVNLVGSVTLFRSEYRADAASEYIVSAWDSRFVANLSGTYDLPRNWSVGARLSAVGGTPYTPYDVEKSSLVEAWDAQGRPYYDYGRYNDGRLDAFAQVDLRIDKTFYFRRCMLGLYIDLQNVTGSKLRRPDVLMSTGVVENPQAPAAEQRYRMKYIGQQSGSLIPTLGITVEF